MRFSLSLRTHLSMIFAITTVLLVLVFGIVYGYRSIKQVETEIGNSLSEAAYLMENNLDQYMWSRYGETTILSNLKDIRQPEDPESVESTLNQLQSTFPSFSWIGLTDAKGSVIASTGGLLKGADISARPVYLNALEKPFVGDVHEAVLLAELLPNPTGEPVKFVDISTPIYNDNNEFTGVLATHLSWEWVKEVEASMLDSVKNREDIEFMIVSKIDDTIILGPDEMMGQKLAIGSLDLARKQNNGWTIETWEDGKQYVTGYMLEDGYKEYPGLGWTILVRQPVEAAYASVKDLLVFFLATGLILVLLFAVLGWWLAGRLASPLIILASVADRLRSEEAVWVPHYKGISELEILYDSLRKLVAKLTKTESALVEMNEIANRDDLTGLANRYAMDLYVHEFVQSHEAATVLYIDLDGFKMINDTFGHHTGDELLVQVAARLRKSIRENELISRVGGDEFIVILPSKKEDGSQKAETVGARIISAINKPYRLDGRNVSISCSIGGAFWEASSKNTLEETIKIADEALYTAKEDGKNRMQVWGFQGV